ncbi:hypothetical protein AABL83_17730 [Myroides odoratimimus]
MQTIRTTGDYVLANAKMDLLADKAPEDGRVKKYLSDPNYLEEVNTNRDGYRVKLLNNVNTAGSEYGAALYKGEIVYSSSTNQKGKHIKVSIVGQTILILSYFLLLYVLMVTLVM